MEQTKTPGTGAPPIRARTLTTPARYRIAVAGLLAAVVLLSLAVAGQHARERRLRAEFAALQRRAKNESDYLWNIERGAVIPQGTRRAVAQEVAKGGTILTPEIDGEAPQIKPGLPDAPSPQSIIGSAYFYGCPPRVEAGLPELPELPDVKDHWATIDRATTAGE